MAIFNFYLTVLLLASLRADAAEGSLALRGAEAADGSLALHGGFSAQLSQLARQQQLTAAELSEVHRVVNETNQILQTIWPGCQLELYGSLVTDLGTPHSDVDVRVFIPGDVSSKLSIANSAKSILEQHPELYSRVRVQYSVGEPTTRAEMLPSHRDMHLTFTSTGPDGLVAGTKLVKYFLHRDLRILKLAIVIKYWTEVQNLIRETDIRSIIFNFMLIFFLQLKRKLPSVAELQKDVDPVMAENWNIAFDEMKYTPHHVRAFDLLCGFFEFYGNFNFETKVISPFVGYPIQRTRFENLTLPKAFELYKSNVANGIVKPLKVNATICIQEPFDHNYNSVASLGDKSANTLKKAFRKAAKIVKKNTDPDLLLTELLQGP